jgi:hypothetical protein
VCRRHAPRASRVASASWRCPRRTGPTGRRRGVPCAVRVFVLGD